jgi:hypothetical protein
MGHAEESVEGNRSQYVEGNVSLPVPKSGSFIRGWRAKYVGSVQCSKASVRKFGELGIAVGVLLHRKG